MCNLVVCANESLLQFSYVQMGRNLDARKTLNYSNEPVPVLLCHCFYFLIYARDHCDCIYNLRLVFFLIL